MNTPKKIVVSVLFVFCCLLSSNNWAWGHHHHGGGFFFGVPFGGYGYGYPYGYGSPYPYYPPTVITVPSVPQTYIQQQAPVVQQPRTNYWHHCSNPEGYYPYVTECPGGWQLVQPSPQQ